ncbi:MAG: uroporphyrinogen-III synthase [Ferruginibacter sp.]
MHEALLQKAAEKNISIDSIPFIRVQQRTDDTTQTTIYSLAAENILAIFTSKNAVEVVAKIVKTIPAWQAACIHGATANAAAAFLGEKQIVLTGNTGKELAAQLCKMPSSLPFVFFAGNKRLDVIPKALQYAGIAFEVITLYDTEATPSVLSKEYDGILFMSPSAADSFFSCNHISNDTVVFAIGETTAAAIRALSPAPVIVAKQHSQENLIQQLIDYYT